MVSELAQTKEHLAMAIHLADRQHACALDDPLPKTDNPLPKTDDTLPKIGKGHRPCMWLDYLSAKVRVMAGTMF